MHKAKAYESGFVPKLHGLKALFYQLSLDKLCLFSPMKGGGGNYSACFVWLLKSLEECLVEKLLCA